MVTAEDRELQRLEEIAILNNIYHRNVNKFRRNSNLSHVVHAVMNLGQFLSVLVNEAFHHIHHAINRKMRAKDKTVPNLPEERNPMFIAYPICMTISLVLGVLWLSCKNFDRILVTSLVGCAIGVILNLASGILSMRHAEIYINLEEVSDAELLRHPIFIHNFTMCVISIMAMAIYLIHFWILYECWLWERDEYSTSGSSSSQSFDEDERRGPQASTSRKNDDARKRDSSESILTFEDLKKRVSNLDEEDLEDEPVILYCCCVDYWNYMKKRNTRQQDHEFQVFHDN